MSRTNGVSKLIAPAVCLTCLIAPWNMRGAEPPTAGPRPAIAEDAPHDDESVGLLPAREGMAIWTLPCTRRVVIDEALPRGRHVERVDGAAARNESLSLQIVLRSDRDLPQVRATVDGLPGATLRWAESANLATRSYRQGVGNGKPIADPLLADPQRDLRADRNEVLWLTWKVPADLPAGPRSARIELAAGDQSIASVALSVRVWGFHLPDDIRPVIEGNLWMHDDWLARYTKRQPWEVWKEYLIDMRAHGINALAHVGLAKIVWGETASPEGLEQYTEHLRFVLDELHFRRFRFPQTSISGGRWDGKPLYEMADLPDAFWIPGSSFRAGCVAGQPGKKWQKRGGSACLTTPGREAAGSWVEYAIEVPAAKAGTYEVWLQNSVNQATETREVLVDGESLGTIAVGPAAANPRGFLFTQKTVSLKPGKHALRVVFHRMIGAADPLNAVILRRPEAAAIERLEIQSLRLTEPFKKAYAAHLRGGMDFFRQHGWADKVQLKLWDEPNVGDYVRVKLAYQFAREVLPGCHLELSEEPSPLLLDTANVWTPYITRFDPKQARQRQEAGDEVWLYANLMHAVDSPGSGIRLIPWMLWKYHLDGYLFWSVNYAMKDPWTTASSMDADAFRRGTFIYPHPTTGGPVDTIRLELFRAGLQDYACLELIDRAAQRAADPGAVRRRLAAEIDSLVRSLGDRETSDAAIEAARQRLDKLAEELAGERGGG